MKDLTNKYTVNNNKFLLGQLDKAIEKKFILKIKNKMVSIASSYISTIKWVEENYGKNAMEKLHEYQIQRNVNRWKAKRRDFKKNSLEEFCKYMEKSCEGTHKWEKLIDKKNHKKYRFTYCLWSEIYRELDAEDIGFWICESDGPAVKAFNPRIEFKRTKTLMKGDDYCNHEYIMLKKE